MTRRLIQMFLDWDRNPFIGLGWRLALTLWDCLAWTPEGHWPVEGRLLDWEIRLSQAGFLRIHRNALVRREAVKAVTDDGEILLPSGKLQISLRRLDEVRRALGVR